MICIRKRIYNGADIIGANLTQANLVRANLNWSKLDKADLSETDLSEAIFIGVNLEKTELANTILPASTKLKDSFASAR